MKRLALPFPALALACALAAAGSDARAQLRVPQLPTLPAVGVPTPLSPLAPSLAATLAPADLQGARRAGIERLLRAHGDVLERDPAGEPVVRGEIVAVPSAPALREAVLGAGVVLVREVVLEGLDERWLVVRPERGTLAAAIARLRAVDPAGRYDYQHVYTGSGAGAPDAAMSDVPRRSAAASDAARVGPLRIGLVDTGIEASHPALRAATLRALACADGAVHAEAHGTAVASLLVGAGAGFRGAAPGATLYAADVYCGAATGGSAEAVARALAWLVREQVAVINVSLVGPANAALERVVAAVVGRGHLLVAAVGNDGAAAPPLYPAAWPGVVAATAIDAQRRVLSEAGRGAFVAFAAPGADMVAAAQGNDGFVAVRGTSFAAPFVAGLLAQRLASPNRAAAQAAVAALAAEAADLGAPGRDPIYGFDAVGERLRVDPTSVRLAASRQ